VLQSVRNIYNIVICNWNLNFFGLKPHNPSFFLSLWNLLYGQLPLQNPTPGIPVAEGGNVFRRLTVAMVHPSQVEALCWRLLGMCGESSAAYILMCAMGFAHSECDGTLCVNCTLSVCVLLCVRFTLDVSLMLTVTHFIHVPCMVYVPLFLHVPLMLIVILFIHVSCILCVPCMLHMPLSCMFHICLVYPVCCTSPIHFLQTHSTIWYFTTSFSCCVLSLHTIVWIHMYMYKYMTLFSKLCLYEEELSKKSVQN
jgi:hypothetical protein